MSRNPATKESTFKVFHAGHGPQNATTKPATTKAPAAFAIHCARPSPLNARRAISTTTSRPRRANRSAMAMKISFNSIGGSFPKSSLLVSNRRAVSTMLAVNHGKNRIRSRPRRTTSSTISAANVSVQRIWSAVKLKLKCMFALSGLRAFPNTGSLQV